MAVDKRSRIFSIIAAVSFLLTAFFEFRDNIFLLLKTAISSFFLLVSIPVVVVYIAYGVVLAIGKSNKVTLRILTLVSFLSGISLAVREAFRYIIQTPPIIGTVFDIMYYDIICTAIYFIVFILLCILFMYSSNSPGKVNEKVLSVLCLLPCTADFVLSVWYPLDTYSLITMLTLFVAFLFTGFWIRREFIIKIKGDVVSES